MSENSYTISQLASEFSITTRTIRFYEEKGLLQPQRKGQQRLYSGADRVRLTLILRGKRIGMSLQESQDIIAMYDPEHGNREQLQQLLGQVEHRKLQLQEQLQDLQHMLAEMDDIQDRCQQALTRALEEEPQL
ncbi:MAG: MerR family DNA-binding transcriptional regulator [Gammaproteobacteria bacterium]|nr:MerR family DNA-binding transcriptional regulator [Gammaproteobacteria bacterium]